MRIADIAPRLGLVCTLACGLASCAVDDTADDLGSVAAAAAMPPVPMPAGAVPGHGWDTPSQWSREDSMVEGRGWRVDRHVRVLADVDADGDDDMVGFGDAGVWLSVADAWGRFEPPRFVVADFGYLSGWRIDKHVRTLADVNADGKPDIVAFGDQGVWLARSTGDGFESPRFVLAELGYDRGWRVGTHPRYVVDIDNDRQADLVGFGIHGVWVARSTGAGFEAPRYVLAQYGTNQSWDSTRHERLMADVNADGRADIVGFGDSGVWLSLAIEGGFEPPRLVISNFATAQGWDPRVHARLLGDVDADGRADIVAIGYHGVWEARSLGTTFEEPRYVLARFGTGEGWRSDQHTRFLADLDGDRRQDIVGITDDGVMRSLSTGTGFAPATWFTGFSNRHPGWNRARTPHLVGDVNGDGLDDLVGLATHGVWAAASRSWEPPAAGRYYLRGAGQRCIDAGPVHLPGALRIYPCSQGLSQVFEVVDVGNGAHHVNLKVYGRCVGLERGSAGNNSGLQLQTCDGSESQRWILDGDSIRAASSATLVATTWHRRSENSMLILKERRLDDAERWELSAIDGSDTLPAHFKRVRQPGELVQTIKGARRGDVVVVDPGLSISVAPADLPVVIPEGVTLRSARRGLIPGAEVHSGVSGRTLFQVGGPGVRITGLRLTGPSRVTDEGFDGKGIRVPPYEHVLIDHNELQGWPTAAIEVRPLVNDEEWENRCAPSLPDLAPGPRVLRNYIHHNKRDHFGYGVVVSDGGFATIEGNTFLGNRHAIASDGHSRSSYHARHNLVHSSAPAQAGGFHSHDFDMHGHGDPLIGPEHTGGVAGQEILVEGNTFFGKRTALRVRGTPCAQATFIDNILHKGDGFNPIADAVEYDGVREDDKLILDGNDYDEAPPSNDDLRVGDFDGDGVDDLFLATGAAWFYAPGAVADWRFLRASTERASALRFGDFDSDGRTDVVEIARGSVAWAGGSPYDPEIRLAFTPADTLVGDLDGDGADDTLETTGAAWRVRYRGRGDGQPFATSALRAFDLRVGDFDGDGKDDVFGSVDGSWSYMPGDGRGWQRLRGALARPDNAGRFVVADFDGNGRADVAAGSYLRWSVSYDGVAGWSTLTDFEVPRYGPLLAEVPIGRFNRVAGADVAYWPVIPGGAHILVSSGGRGEPTRSGDEMR